ncbi:MAG: hypothetical protein L3V56_13305 [Candidatus Magnetoovum sp. WYHC-5]|nr:hypothetical protein [Candidatus Magnetoovum sp. WYHC-5]
MGQLLQFLELSTVVIGFLFGVNPFNQPWIEKGKENIFAMLSKDEFCQKKELLKRLRLDNVCWRL